jgi:hypothetical protein
MTPVGDKNKAEAACVELNKKQEEYKRLCETHEYKTQKN